MSSFTSFDEAVRAVALEWANVVIKKQHDYGKDNILKHRDGPERGVVRRLDDKLNRIENLVKNELTPDNETVDETWGDVIGYGLVGEMVRRGLFTLPLEER